jgi:hypothetical protein
MANAIAVRGARRGAGIRSSGYSLWPLVAGIIAPSAERNAMTAPSCLVTAAVLVIGDEILSGRTKDKNIGYIAEYLTNFGIDLKEVRVVPDEEDEIVTRSTHCAAATPMCSPPAASVRRTTTSPADSVAKAFRRVDRCRSARGRDHEGALRGRGVEMNEARLRMARIPAGAELVENKQSARPGS